MNKKKIIITCITIILILFIASMIYLCTGTYKADGEALSYLNSAQTVNISKIEEGYFFDGPGNDTAIVFYPGAKVEYTAYSQLMYKIAENGSDCFLIKMPFNMAILGKNKAQKILEQYNYENWYISGHSMGGVMACMYASDHPEKIKGVITLASYPAKALPQNIEYISIYGSEDKVLSIDELNKAKKYLPEKNDEYVIDGGNHSGFANYGEQKGDGKASITNVEQQEYVIDVLLKNNLLNLNDGNNKSIQEENDKNDENIETSTQPESEDKKENSNSNEIEENTSNKNENTTKEENKTQNENVKKDTKEKEKNASKEEGKKESSKSDKDIEKSENKKSKGKTIVIDPGHQTKGDSSKEPIGPGATETKAKVTTGATGVYTKQTESELNLKVALLLEKELKQKGYTVIMTRRTNNVNISNSQRAKIANDANADAFIRIHADSVDTESVNGMSTLCQTSKNKYNGKLANESYKLSKYILDSMAKETGAKNRGVTKTDTMSGINWSKVPVTIIEMGFLSNEKEDKLLASNDYQKKIVKGIVTGIEKFLK